MTFQGLLLVLLTAAFTASGNLMMKSGIASAGGVSLHLSDFWSELVSLIRQPAFDLGVLLYIVATLLWFRVISHEQLSLSYPILISLSLVFVTLGAVSLFQESIGAQQVLGMCIIAVGILLVSASGV